MVKPPIPPDPLLSATLADAEKYVYKAECQGCHHITVIDLKALRETLGRDFPVRDMRKNLRCKKCGERGPVISFIPVGSSLLIR